MREEVEEQKQMLEVEKAKIETADGSNSASVKMSICFLKPKFNRKPIAAISLAQDTSTITACGNDYSFDIQFSRSLEALGKKNDILIAISTSGNSKNIINVLKTAKKMKIFSIGFLGNRGGKSKNLCDIPLVVNSNNTARIQETHIFLGHFIFESVETRIIR